MEEGWVTGRRQSFVSLDTRIICDLMTRTDTTKCHNASLAEDGRTALISTPERHVPI